MMTHLFRPAALAALLAAWTAPASALVGPSSDGAALAPFVVMVLHRAGSEAGFCSGIVVARDIVLTAAHCVPPGADLRVHFKDERGGAVLLPVETVVRNPGYKADAVRKRERSIDLAAIRLAEPLPGRFRPATIAGAPPAIPVDALVRVAGFGVTRENDGASSGRLRVADLAARAPLSAVLLWAKDPRGAGAGACEGDSGGPVFVGSDDTVAALTSWASGDGRNRCGTLTQALWLAPHKAWIEGVIAGWAADPQHP